MKKLTTLVIFALASASFALQGGPSQPDYVQFEPTGIQDMVDLLTGDFTYQIPLGEVPSPYGGFPLSLSYHAGISPQQEASWVGLGWFLNPGVINRTVRGVPDDQFHGGTLGFVYRYSTFMTWAVELGYSNSVFSVGQTFSSDGTVGYSATLGYRIAGMGSVGFTVGSDEIGIDAHLGMNEYASVNMGVSYSSRSKKVEATVGAGVHAGGAHLGAQYSSGNNVSARVGFGEDDRSIGMTVSSDGVNAYYSDRGTSIFAGSNGVGVSVAGTGLPIANSVAKGKSKESFAGLAIIVPTQIGVFSSGFSQSTNEYWLSSISSEYLYGYMYQSGPAIDVDRENELVGIPYVYQNALSTHNSYNIDWDFTKKGKTLEALGDNDMYPAYDIYSVSSEGLSGSFRPYARESHSLYKKISDRRTRTDNVESYSTILTEESKKNEEFVMFANEEFVLDANRNMVVSNEYPDYKKCNDGSGKPCSVYGEYETYYRNKGNRLVYNSKENEFEERSGMRFLFVGESNGYYESEPVGAGANRDTTKVSDLLLKRTLKKSNQDGNYDYDYALYGSRKIKPIFEENNPSGRLQGFEIVKSDGTKYIFDKPVRSYLKVDYSINQPTGTPLFIDHKVDKYEEFLDHLVDGLIEAGIWGLKHLIPEYGLVSDISDILFPEGTLEENCKTDDDGKDNKKDVFYSYTIDMNPHATQWLLSEIRGADFVQLGEGKSVGYNVKFNYSEPSLYKWRTPYARPNLPAAEHPNFKSLRDGFTPEGCNSKIYQASFGVKEYVYLKSIETSTHRAEFKLNETERIDGKGWETGNKLLPILAETGLSLKLNDLSSEKKEATFEPHYIYFNSEVPSEYLRRVKNEKVPISLRYGGALSAYNDDCHRDFVLKDGGNDIEEAEFLLMADSDKMEKCTDEKELKFGMYKLAVKSVIPYKMKFGISGTDCFFKSGDDVFVGGGPMDGTDWEGMDFIRTSLFVDWGSIFSVKDNPQKYDNQMRYLEEISFFKKGENDPYRKFKFDYDYSLQPKTLNSYCFASTDNSGNSIKGYPENNLQITSSEEVAKVGACESASEKALYGKLTLKSIQETGCQNGKCASLPPFKFDYYSKNATPTQISDREEWIEHLATTSEEKKDKSAFDKFTDVDASILSTTNAIDEYGFWSQNANDENHKVDQSFADFGASSWSLNKVVDPAGGVLEIEYERDSYSNAESYGDDFKTVNIMDFNKCSSYKDKRGRFDVSSNDNRLCIRIGQLYWKEQCLGPRKAYWSKNKPDSYEGDGFEYLNEIGIEKEKRLYYNLKSGVGTTVDCGWLGVGNCDRSRTAGILGDGVIKDILDNKENQGDGSRWKLLVLDRDYESNIKSGLEKAAQKINPKKSWDIAPFGNGSFGTIWPVQEFSELKGGDLRVTRLSRHDINLNSQTVYDYGVGELAQLADSSYTTVLGNRFNSGKVSYALPDVDVKPKSRVVGINDDDLLLIPGPRITYPVVNVSTSSNDGETSVNGRTEFKHVTPETGIPSDYIDEDTKQILEPFLKVNVRLVKSQVNGLWHDYEKEHYFSWSADENQRGWIDLGGDGRMLEFTLLDASGKVIGNTIRKTLYEQDLSQIYFYAENVKEAYSLRVKEIDEIKEDSDEENGFTTELPLLRSGEKLTSFNEMMIAVRCGKLNTAPRVTRSWFRSHPEGFYPIVYKKVDYSKKKIWRPFMKDISVKKPFMREEQSYLEVQALFGVSESMGKYVENDVDSDITYYDFTSFLGLNYKTTIYRGPKNQEIPVKMDSVVYSTKITSALENAVNQSEEILPKMGQQKERWTSTSKLDCKSEDLLNICAENNIVLREKEGQSEEKNFSHVRFPVFQIGSITYSGNDNLPVPNDGQTGQLKSLMNKTELRNYRYDPATGLPTVSLAKMKTVSKNGIDREVHKATVMTPYYVLNSNPVADSMFVRNMLSQNYMEEVYFDTVAASGDWNSILHENENEDKKKYQSLRTFRISPYKLFTVNSSANRNPILAWGTFDSKKDPASIRSDAWNYADASAVPDLNDYSGEIIQSIDENYKVLELKNSLARTTTLAYSKDGLRQVSIAYPSKKENVAVIVPYAQEASFNNCEEPKNKLSNKNGMLATAKSVVLKCTVQKSDNVGAGGENSVVVEYKKWSENNGWQMVSEIKTFAGASYTYSLSLAPDEQLNYLRIYPKNAMAKTFVYDVNGNLIQIVAEDNTSTYYEYDPLGFLVQSRNDDGVSFKAHHREYKNDASASDGAKE